MPDPITPKRLKFLECLLAGKTPREAYVAAGFREGPGATAAIAELLHLPEMQQRLAELQEERLPIPMLREELIQWLCNIIRTPVGQIDAENPLAQEVVHGARETVRVKIIGKLDAAKFLASLMGWTKPDKEPAKGKQGDGELSDADILAEAFAQLATHHG